MASRGAGGILSTCIAGDINIARALNVFL